MAGIEKRKQSESHEMLAIFEAQRTERVQDAARIEGVLDIKRRQLTDSGPGSKTYSDLKAKLSAASVAEALGEREDVSAADIRDRLAELDLLPSFVEGLEIRLSEARSQITSVDGEIHRLQVSILHDEAERLGEIYAKAATAAASTYRDLAAVAAKLAELGYPIGRFDGEGFMLPAFGIEAHKEVVGVNGQLTVAADIRAGGEALARQDSIKMFAARAG